MGNITSKTNNNTNIVDIDKTKDTMLGEIIDFIATKYILTLDFENLKNLYKKEYCDNLVVLTSEILDAYFNNLEIANLNNRIQQGSLLNADTTEDEFEQVVYFSKDDISKLGLLDPVKKQNICINISKFYVKIAHLFAAILTSINPVFSYVDDNGIVIKVKLEDKDKIPEGKEVEIFSLNICDNRINALQRNYIFHDSDNVSIHPKVCNMNIKLNGETKSLEDEPGIEELYELYLDDGFDYETGNFTSMSPDVEKQYKEDLQKFYTAFTGQEVMPDTITKFSDIKLRNYNLKDGCSKNLLLEESVSGNITSDKLFEAYAANLSQMMNKSKENQEKLLVILNKMFSYVDDLNGGKIIRINPELTESTLSQLIELTRDLLVDYYVTCEEDYTTGVKIYEAIVEKKIFDTARNQIKNLEAETERLMYQDIESDDEDT